MKHVVDIRDKYLISGETQDMALMFVPSESLFARLHEEFDDVVQKAHRARVIIVSPSLFVVAIQLVRSLNRD
ncbi:DNA recombination protein RmuC, partial [Acinetobacter baumannii]